MRRSKMVTMPLAKSLKLRLVKLGGIPVKAGTKCVFEERKVVVRHGMIHRPDPVSAGRVIGLKEKSYTLGLWLSKPGLRR